MTTDYTTLADIKAWLHVSGDADDLLLSRMITAASAWIATFLSREVSLSDHVEQFDGVNGRRQMLTHTPVTGIYSVTIDDVAIDAARFRRDPFGVVLKDQTFTRGYGNVSISYAGGYESIPEDIVQCCIDIVAFHYRRRERIGHGSKSIGGETVAFTVTDVPSECRQVLKQYRRVVPL